MEWFDTGYGARRKSQDGEFVNGRFYPQWANGGEIRSREEYPYGYSFFVTHGPMCKIEGEDLGGAYSDRMASWDREAWEDAWAAMNGKNRFNYLTLADLSRFLTRYNRRETECLQALEGCNVSNGYPLWYFVWRHPTKAMETRKGQAATQLGAKHDSAVAEPFARKDSPNG